MGLFNVPLDQTHYTLRAVQAALKMRADIAEFHRHAGEDRQLNFGVGINAGEAVVGNVGTEQQMNYSAIGDAVNYAKRLQENAKGGQILISQTAYRQVEDFIEAIALPPLQVKGRSTPEIVYEVIGLK
jgi:class 3 adenylate cyclase